MTAPDEEDWRALLTALVVRVEELEAQVASLSGEVDSLMLYGHS